MDLVFDIRRISAAAGLTLLGLATACSASATATDTMPNSDGAARQLARTVASNGDCGSFEDYNFNRARDTWVFTCQKSGTSFEILAYGSPDARSAGIKSLDASKTTYVAKNFYSVAVVKSEGNNSVGEALASFNR